MHKNLSGKETFPSRGQNKTSSHWESKHSLVCSSSWVTDTDKLTVTSEGSDIFHMNILHLFRILAAFSCQ